jgi:hypothetical protein
MNPRRKCGREREKRGTPTTVITERSACAVLAGAKESENMSAASWLYAIARIDARAFRVAKSEFAYSLGVMKKNAANQSVSGDASRLTSAAVAKRLVSMPVFTTKSTSRFTIVFVGVGSPVTLLRRRSATIAAAIMMSHAALSALMAWAKAAKCGTSVRSLHSASLAE